MQKRKTVTNEITEKKTVSESEDELVVRIPLIVGPRLVIVEPQAVITPFEVEEARVTN